MRRLNMGRFVRSFCCLSSFVVSAGFGPMAHAESDSAGASQWEWSITPYVWLADTSFELKARDQSIGAGEIDSGEIADALDGAFQILIETGQGHWSGFVDFTYLSMSDDQRIELPNLGSLRVDTGSDQYFVDAAIAYWPWPDVSGFNV